MPCPRETYLENHAVGIRDVHFIILLIIVGGGGIISINYVQKTNTLTILSVLLLLLFSSPLVCVNLNMNTFENINVILTLMQCK